MNMTLRTAKILLTLCLCLSQGVQSQTQEAYGSAEVSLTVTVIAPTPTCVLGAGTATSLIFPGRVAGDTEEQIQVSKANGGQVTFTKSSGCGSCTIADPARPSTLSSGSKTVRVWTSRSGTGSMTSASQTYHLWGIVEFKADTSAGTYTGDVTVSASCA